MLSTMMQPGRWMDVADYLGRVMRANYRDLLGAAVPTEGRSAWDLRWSHPELYMLPRLQDALELARGGQLQQARDRYADLVQVIGDARHNGGDAYANLLGGVLQILADATADGAGIITEEVVSEQTARTRTAIQDYLYAYLPKTTGRLELKYVVDDDTGCWLFGVRLGGRPSKFRCLLCHMEQTGDLSHLRRHLGRCKASSLAVRSAYYAGGSDDDDDPGAGPSGGDDAAGGAPGGVAAA
ncbi:hypothetical protein ACP4OV_022990 [Aristida adscensionis]